MGKRSCTMREDGRSSRTLALETMTVPLVAIIGTVRSFAGIAAPLSPRTSPQRCYLSIGGKAVEPAGATGGVERRLAAPLAHMHRIPRHVPATGAVRVAEHGARTLRREVCIRLWQRQAIRGPIAAGVIETVGERPALRV